MRRVRLIFGHTDIGERPIDAQTDFLRLHTHVFRPERNILLDNGCNDLIVRILKHHAHRLSNVIQPVLIFCIDAAHLDNTFVRHEDRVKMLCKR